MKRLCDRVTGYLVQALSVPCSLVFGYPDFLCSSLLDQGGNKSTYDGKKVSSYDYPIPLNILFSLYIQM